MNERELNVHAKRTVAEMLKQTYLVPFGDNLMRFNDPDSMERYAMSFGRTGKGRLTVVRGDCTSCGAPLSKEGCLYCGRDT